MSLSKPFQLLDLAYLPFEKVLQQIDSWDLLKLAMLSKKIQGKVKSVKGLVDYCDVVAFRSYPHPVDVSIRMKSDGVVFHGEPCLLVFHCLVRCYKVEKKGRHFFYEKAEHVLELPLLKSCDELEFLSYDDETFTEIIKRVDARKSITIDCYQLKEPNWSWMENEKVRRVKQLICRNAKMVSKEQFLNLDNENMTLEMCSIPHDYLNAYLKKWVDGGFKKLKTLNITSAWFTNFDELFDKLNFESLPTLEKEGNQRLIQFSSELYINPTPHNNPRHFRTVILKNCQGQLATAVRTNRKFYFVVWNSTVTEEVQVSREFCLVHYEPFAITIPIKETDNDTFKLFMDRDVF